MESIPSLIGIRVAPPAREVVSKFLKGGFPMVQLMLTDFLKDFEKVYLYSTAHPEVVLGCGLICFLLLKRRVKSALILVFGVALCVANYFVFMEYTSLAIPLIYAAGFAGISIILILLLVYQFIHTS